MKFSWPQYHNELVILIAASATGVNTWGFLTPFSWQLWVALVATSLLVGLLVWVAEWAATRREASGSKFSTANMKTIGYSAWQAAGKIVAITQNLDKVNTLAARIIVWAYGLLIMVVLATYTANTAAQLTTVSLQTNIHNLADLRGKAVGTWDGYKRIFNGSNAQDYPFSPQFLPWNNEADEAVMLQALRSNRIVALLIDEPFAQVKASTNCDLHIVGSSFEPTDLGLAFPSWFPDRDIRLFSEASKANAEDGLLKNVYRKYFNSSTACDPLDTSGAIQFTQLSGLWYIMGMAIVVAIFCIAGSHITWATGTNKLVAQHTKSIARKSFASAKWATSFKVQSMRPRSTHHSGEYLNGDVESINGSQHSRPQFSRQSSLAAPGRSKTIKKVSISTDAGMDKPVSGSLTGIKETDVELGSNEAPLQANGAALHMTEQQMTGNYDAVHEPSSEQDSARSDQERLASAAAKWQALLRRQQAVQAELGTFLDSLRK
eukprot:jgi/Botrbrau1/7142/Bobra.0143s0019.1